MSKEIGTSIEFHSVGIRINPKEIDFDKNPAERPEEIGDQFLSWYLKHINPEGTKLEKIMFTNISRLLEIEARADKRLDSLKKEKNNLIESGGTKLNDEQINKLDGKLVFLSIIKKNISNHVNKKELNILDNTMKEITKQKNWTEDLSGYMVLLGTKKMQINNPNLGLEDAIRKASDKEKQRLSADTYKKYKSIILTRTPNTEVNKRVEVIKGLKNMAKKPSA